MITKAETFNEALKCKIWNIEFSRLDWKKTKKNLENLLFVDFLGIINFLQATFYIISRGGRAFVFLLEKHYEKIFLIKI